MNVLGIESSCDETSAAVLSAGTVASNVISSQYVHRAYGGVVPELASRAHQRLIVDVVTQALSDAQLDRTGISAVAATYGPGLVGALLVGLNFGKALAYGLDVPFIGVNHMEGHLYSNFLAGEPPQYPFLSLIVSGGHTMLVHVRGPLVHTILGQTRDDAAGEAFDKVAKMLGLGYPGGPAIDSMARKGNPRAIRFPRAYLGDGGFEFSFSGIKTAVLYHLRDRGFKPGTSEGLLLPEQQTADLCASFQAAVVDVLVDKTFAAAEETGVGMVTLAGGVSANSELRRRMEEGALARGLRLSYPTFEYCMDNAAMIAYAGYLHLSRGDRSPFTLAAVSNLDIE